MQIVQPAAPDVNSPGTIGKGKRSQTDERGRIDNKGPSPLLKDGEYRNKGRALEMSFSAWEFFFSGKDRTPNTELPLKPVDLKHFNSPETGQLNVTWLGHSSLMINIDGYRILMDPVFEKRISIFGPTRFSGDLPLDINQLSQVDAVVVSHNHYDHLNKLSIKRLNEKTEKFIVPQDVGVQLEKWGVPKGKIAEMGWWQEFQFDEKLTIAATPSQHFSGRGLFDRNKTLWASWVIGTPFHKVFFSGDSGYFDGFKRIGDKYGPFDMTFIECGAYNESWAPVHMFPEQTLQAHLDLKGNVLHPIHWATFNLSMHPWFEPMERLTAAAEGRNVVATTPVFGETAVFGKNLPSSKWWRKAMKETAVNASVPKNLSKSSER